MTDTTPDYARMIDLINVLATDRKRDEEHDAKETCDKSAEALRTLLESNAALERERDLFKELYAKECHARLVERDWLNTRIEALERERNQLLDKLHCMCGSPIDHSAWEGHTPVSVYDYSLDQERSRAEAAEARVTELEDLCNSLEAQAMGLAYDLKRAEAQLAEAMKALAALDRVNRGVDWCDQYEQARRWSAARKFLKENGNGK